MRNRSVLVVDDEFLITELLSTMLRDLGMDVCGIASTAEDALALAEAHTPSLVLMDVRLNGRDDGIDAAAAIRKVVGAPVIFITGSVDPATIERIGDVPVLYKPVRFDQFRSAILRAIS